MVIRRLYTAYSVLAFLEQPTALTEHLRLLFTENGRPVHLVDKDRSFLKPIERLWLHLKTPADATCLHTNPGCLQRAIETRLNNQSAFDHPDCLLFVDNLRSVA